MCRLVSVAFLLFLVAGQSSGVEWVQMTAGDLLPAKSVQFALTREYVGRARHFNDILPAIVRENGTATVEVCGKQVTKHNFEVLTSSTLCSWQHLIIGEHLPEGLVPVGHRDAIKALFIGLRDGYSSYTTSYYMHAFSLGDEVENWIRNGFRALVCPTENQWIDVSAKKVPRNAVYAGKSTNGKEVFVARLQKECVVYPGALLPEEGIATAMADGELIVASYCQVLIDDSNRYRWVPLTEDDEFPDNAVVGSTDAHNLYYIAKQLGSNETTYVTNLFTSGDYAILIDHGIKLKPETDLDFSQSYDDSDDDYNQYRPQV